MDPIDEACDAGITESLWSCDSLHDVALTDMGLQSFIILRLAQNMS